MKKMKIVIILGIIIFIALILISILSYNPERKEKIKLNRTLSSDEMQTLLKFAQYHLNKSEKLEDYSITDEYMIVFALDYIDVSGEYRPVEYFDDYTKVRRLDIERAVEYVFGKSINYNNVNFEKDDEYINVPIYPFGTDAEIYKFRAREYNSDLDFYIAYIDCIESSPSKFNELSENKVTEYDENNIKKTMVFKYKEQDGRKILLAFNVEYNY